jgi:hypothetical protein
MPLLDHFHPPLSERRTWEGFHGLWAAALVEKLNEDILGEEFYADMQVHIGGRVEVDVATLSTTQDDAAGTGAVAAPAWAPPTTALVLPIVFPDDIEVQVFATATGATLVGAIELVSPANKDRPDTRTAFAAKCVAYLTRGIGLIVVDVVTNRLANLHNETMTLLGRAAPFLLPGTAAIYAVAYRPARRPDGDRIEVWPHVLTLGQPLPLLPLALRNAETVPVDLEGTYTDACRRSKIG